MKLTAASLAVSKGVSTYTPSARAVSKPSRVRMPSRPSQPQVYNNSDDYSTGIYQGFKAQAETVGLEIVSTTTFPDDTIARASSSARNFFFIHPYSFYQNTGLRWAAAGKKQPGSRAEQSSSSPTTTTPPPATPTPRRNTWW